MDSPTIPNLAQLKAALESTRTASRKSALTGKAAKRELQVGCKYGTFAQIWISRMNVQQ